MKREEINLIVAEESLHTARKEHNEAMAALERAYGRGAVTEPFSKAEQAARQKLMDAELRYKKCKDAIQYAKAISDDEVDAIVANIVGNNQKLKQEASSEEDEGFCKMILNNL